MCTDYGDWQLLVERWASARIAAPCTFAQLMRVWGFSHAGGDEYVKYIGGNTISTCIVRGFLPLTHIKRGLDALVGDDRDALCRILFLARASTHARDSDYHRRYDRDPSAGTQRRAHKDHAHEFVSAMRGKDMLYSRRSVADFVTICVVGLADCSRAAVAAAFVPHACRSAALRLGASALLCDGHRATSYHGCPTAWPGGVFATYDVKLLRREAVMGVHWHAARRPVVPASLDTWHVSYDPSWAPDEIAERASLILAGRRERARRRLRALRRNVAAAMGMYAAAAAAVGFIDSSYGSAALGRRGRGEMAAHFGAAATGVRV
jgi:hypothetical protein